jgi:ribonuclease HII
MDNLPASGLTPASDLTPASGLTPASDLTPASSLKPAYCLEEDILEIGVDEAGRGPMFGRVYAGAVSLPKSMVDFNHALMKDSKKFHSEKKIREVAAYIKTHALAWAVGWADEREIDELNIRRATHKAMHQAIKEVIAKQEWASAKILLVDGNDFTPFVDKSESIVPVPLHHVCIEGGDNTYSCIAAASILAKVARDDYIAELCAQEPDLITRYDLLKNKGYGTKKHMDGIKQYGITQWHRKTFGICKQF